MTALVQMCLWDLRMILDLSFPPHPSEMLHILSYSGSNGATITSLMLKPILPNIRHQRGQIPLCTSLTPLKLAYVHTRVSEKQAGVGVWWQLKRSEAVLGSLGSSQKTEMHFWHR